MKNPFPNIGKVIKYELKHSAKRLVPFYGVLLALGLLTGLTFNVKKINTVIPELGLFSENEILNTQNVTAGIVTAVLGSLVWGFSIVVTAITIGTVAKRFRKSMLGDEAYMTLTLPVSIGEQLWGRFIVGMLWFVCCGLVILLTGILCCVKMNLPQQFKYLFMHIAEWNAANVEENLTIAKVFWLGILALCSFAAWIITFIFAVNAISHLLRSKNAFIRVLIFIALAFVYIRLGVAIFDNVDVDGKVFGDVFTKVMLLYSGMNVLWTGCYFAITQFVFTKKLNLE